MNRPLSGRTALITGSTQGIGLSAARRLAAEGCHVVLHGLGDAGASETVRAALERDHGVRVLHDAADLRDAAQIERLIARAADVLGAIDILVNNAVVRHTAPIGEFSSAAWDESVAVNLSAAFHATRLVVPRMRERGWGRIVNVSSIYGLRGAANRVAYVTTKTALIGLTRAVALETVADGITCNAVCPGTTETPIHDASVAALVAARGLSDADAVREVLRGKQPSGRLIGVDNVAALIAFLSGPESADITGAVLPIDGGWSAS